MKVVVVGGGIIGLCAAHYLSRAGARVTIVDRAQLGGACSAGNAGWICPSISFPLPSPGLTTTSLRWLLKVDSPLYLKPSALFGLAPWLLQFRRYCNQRAFELGASALAGLAADSIPLYEEMAAEGVTFESHHEGLLFLFRHAAGIAEEQEMLRLTGYEDRLRPIAKDELAEFEPALAPGLAGGLLATSELHVRPESLCAGLAASLCACGAEIVENTVVDSIRSKGGGVVAVDTSSGPMQGDAFLFSTGAETGGLTARLDHPLPLQAGKGYSVTVGRPKIEVNRPLYFVDTKLAITPFDDAVRIAGTMELAGINLDLNQQRLRALERVAESSVPGVLDGRRGEPWVGMRPLTPDGLPLMGRIATRDNAFVATGHQMLGLTLAPATGKAMAELILAGEADADLVPFEPSRFG